MLTQFHGGQADGGVHVVGNADDDRVDLLVQRIEHLAVIVEALRLGVVLERVSRALLVDVAKRDDVLAGHLVEVLGPLPAAADDGEVQLIVWACWPGGHGGHARRADSNPRCAEGVQHLSAIPVVSHERGSSHLFRDQKVLGEEVEIAVPGFGEETGLEVTRRTPRNKCGALLPIGTGIARSRRYKCSFSPLSTK